MKKVSFLISALLACTGVVMTGTLTSCTAVEKTTENCIKSVKISNAPSSMTPGEKVTLTAKVTKTKDAPSSTSTKVEWSSSDEEIATVSSKGVVEAKKPGSVEITATSVADEEKSATVAIEVIDPGFSPDLIEEGFTFTKSFPATSIKSFLGKQNALLPEPDITDGCYFIQYEEETIEDEYFGDQTYPAEFDVIVKGDQVESYINQLLADQTNSWDRCYYSDYEGGYVFIEPNNAYTLLISNMVDYEIDEETWEITYTDLGMTQFIYYKNEDVWGSEKATSDTSWDMEEAEIVSMEYDNTYMLKMLEKLPFVKMGEDYEFSTLVEDYGFFVYPVPNSLQICDYSVNDDLLANYGSTLTTNGFTKYSDEETEFYYSQINDFATMYVFFYWGENGNTIEALVEADPLPAFPSTSFDNFVKENISQLNKVPHYSSFARTEEYSFLPNEGYVYDEEEMTDGSTYKYAELDITGTTLSTFTSYLQTLKDNGYELSEYTTDNLSEEGYIEVDATKGGIYLQMAYYANYDQTTEEYDLVNGEVMMYVLPSGVEDKAVSFKKSETTIKVGGTEKLEVETLITYDTLTFSSNNESVATVASDGTVTAVAKGTAEISATITVGTDTYTDKMTVNVAAVATAVTINGKDEIKSEGTATYTVVANPKEDIIEGTPVWSIKETTTAATIDSSTGVLTAGIVEEDVTVTVVVNVGGLTAEKVVTIKAVPQSITEVLNITSADSAKTQSGVTVTYSKGTGSSDPAYYNSKPDETGMRLYTNNTITIKAPAGVEITQIQFETVGYGKKTEASLSASTGSYKASTHTWTGSANQVVLTVGSGQFRFDKITITCGGDAGEGGGGGGTETETDILDAVKELAFNVLGDEDGYEYDDEEDCYYFYCEWGTTSQYTLVSAVEEAMEYTPDVFAFMCDEAVVEDEWDDGDPGAFMTLCNEEETLFCDIGSYAYDGIIYVQFVVYEE